MDRQTQHLRHTVTPYIGQIVILSMVTLFALFISMKTHEWALLLSVPVMWALFLPFAYFGLQYQVHWTDNEVCQKASGGADIHIKYDEIARLALEVSKAGELLSASRPFRRIAIYAENSRGLDKFIDVSLKHFAMDDIRKLMSVIHQRRPDLTLPEHWVV